jgi:predicted TIM-barrel fold metal-dependent hydrolase
MQRKRMNWLKRRKTAEELPFEPPIRLGNMSNGEFFHQSTPMEQRVRREILRQAEEKSRKLGMDRREFLASAMGMATSLSVLNLAASCAKDAGGKPSDAGFIDMGRAGTGVSGSSSPASAAGGGAGRTGPSAMGVMTSPSGAMTPMSTGTGRAGSSSPSSSGSGGFGGYGGSSPGSGGMSASANGGAGGYMVTPEMTMNCEMAEDMLNGKGEFIFDIQTHHIEEEGDWRTTNPSQGYVLGSFFTQYNMCMNADPQICIDAQAYLEHIFLESDTTVCVLSGYPAPLCTEMRTTGCGNPLDNDLMWKSRDRFNMMAKSQRVVQHCQVNPTDDLPKQLAMMERIKKEHDCWGFKAYPEWGPDGRGWMLDDPKSGIPMIEKARELNSKIICIHKGIVFPGWDAAASDPKDVGVVAQMYPDTSFVVYHSAIEMDASGEGVYNPMNTLGTDRLCRTVDENGLKGKNVYAELGSCWAQVMNAPEKAQHVIGKLLKYVGPDNVVWGSECVWLGSPQPQIEAFRTFQISKEFQDMYGYPEITDEIRAKVFGLNAARVYGIDTNATHCKIRETKLAQLKRDMDGELGGRRWAFRQPLGPRTLREFWTLAKKTGGSPFPT